MVLTGVELLVAGAAIATAAAISRRTASDTHDSEAMKELTKDAYKPTQHLIGEELVDETNVYAFADRMMEEADRIWGSSAADWRAIPTKSNVVNEAIGVSGLFADSGILLTRGSAIVDAPADKLFALLASPAGYHLIDPFTDPKDHEKPPIQVYDATKWRMDVEPVAGAQPRRLEAATALARIPLMARREFIVLNGIDYNTRYFLSKSIQHKNAPGTSAFGPDGHVPPSNGTVRALNTFGVQIDPSPEHPETQCVVRVLNFADLGGKFPVIIANFAGRNFIVDLVGRMRKAMAADKAKLTPSS